MRLWSIHPSYLDAKGLVALWREGLLARKVLMGETKGYRNHPQLLRFRLSTDPIAAINFYLEIVTREAKVRGYTFDDTKITKDLSPNKITVTDGQVAHEVTHLHGKLVIRDPKRIDTLLKEKKIKVHPLFTIKKGAIETWEKITDNPNTFPYDLDFKNINFRTKPELYVIGKGEQGVLMVEPYKSEILPHWRFRTPEIAKSSAKKIYSLFLEYKKQNDFVGMDMSRKFLQMGYTRSRRYANHTSGRKYEHNPQNEVSLQKEKQARKKIIPQAQDWATNEKAQSAKIFYEYYLKAKNDKAYKKTKLEWQESKKHT